MKSIQSILKLVSYDTDVILAELTIILAVLNNKAYSDNLTKTVSFVIDYNIMPNNTCASTIIAIRIKFRHIIFAIRPYLIDLFNILVFNFELLTKLK